MKNRNTRPLRNAALALLLLSSAGAAWGRNHVDDGGGGYPPPPPASPATPVPGKASASQIINVEGTAQTSGDQGYLTLGDAGTAYAYSEVVLSGVPHVYVEASSAGAKPGGRGGYEAFATSSFEYDITLTAKTLIQAASIATKLGTVGGIATATGTYDIEASGAAQAYGTISGHVAGGADDQAYFDDIACCDVATFDIPLQFVQSSTNSLQFVSHFAASATVTALDSAGSGSVYIDPEIVLTDAFRTTDFSLTIADGTVPNAAIFVPEPAVWTMMLAGFALVGATLRRRATLDTRLTIGA